MREIINYELVVSEEKEERLLLTFSWEEVGSLPLSVTSFLFDKEESKFIVTFEDSKKWEEISFINLPVVLHDVVDKYKKITVVGLSDEVELFSEVKIDIK